MHKQHTWHKLVSVMLHQTTLEQALGDVGLRCGRKIDGKRQICVGLRWPRIQWKIETIIISSHTLSLRRAPSLKAIRERWYKCTDKSSHCRAIQVLAISLRRQIKKKHNSLERWNKASVCERSVTSHVRVTKKEVLALKLIGEDPRQCENAGCGYGNHSQKPNGKTWCRAI